MIKNSKIEHDNSLNSVFLYSYKLLNKKERYLLRKNIILSFFAGIFEIFSVTTVYPLVSIIVEPNLVETNKLINKIWIILGSPTINNFVILLSLSASLVLLLSVFLNLSTQILTTRDASSSEERLAKELYRDLIYSPYKWHLINNPNIVRNSLLNDVNLWNRCIIKIIPSLSGQLSGIIFAFFTIIIATPKLGFILFLISGSLLTIFLKLIRKKTNKLMKAVSIKQGEINIFVTESLSGIKDIKLSSNEENFIKIFNSINHIIIKNFASATNWNNLPSYVVILFGQLSILILSAVLFISGIAGGELAAIMAIIVLVFSRTIPLFNKLGSSFNNVSNYSSFIKRLSNTIISIEREKQQYPKKNIKNIKQINFNWDKVIFSSVEFSYPKSHKPILKEFNLEINKGFHYAFVGPSGAGKSTAIDLFLGLLEPNKGNILIDSFDLREIGIRNWQKKISYVPQEPLIRDISLRENIAFGIPKDSIDNERVFYCLKQTQLLEVCNSLENGIYSNLGNKGINLSGGQKQRVAISRALYQNTEILVLDEATSSLDNKTERIIQNTIKNLKTKMTVISIAHRFSTIKNCDWIFLLENGTLKEEGTYEELKKNSALFRELAKSQINDIN